MKKWKEGIGLEVKKSSAVHLFKFCNLTFESAIGCQKARGIVLAVTAATPLYHDESAFIGVRLRRPRFNITGEESPLFESPLFNLFTLELTCASGVASNFSGSSILVYIVPKIKEK